MLLTYYIAKHMPKQDTYPQLPYSQQINCVCQ